MSRLAIAVMFVGLAVSAEELHDALRKRDLLAVKKALAGGANANDAEKNNGFYSLALGRFPAQRASRRGLARNGRTAAAKQRPERSQRQQ